MNDAADDSEIIEIALKNAFQQRPVNTEIFSPYLMARLMEHPAVADNSLEYRIHLQDVGSPGTRLIRVKWTWTEAMIPPTPLAAQREFITESAAYALAFAVLSGFTSASLISTAQRGERFDYILSEDGVHCGVEISGTQTDERQTMRDRQIQKTRQLLASSKRWGGYVVIVGFARREVWLSRHAPEGAKP